MSESEAPVTRDIVLDVTLPRVKSVGRVEVRRIRIQAGLAVGTHTHNGPVFGNIITGSAIYQIEGEPATTLRAGDVFYEPEGARIARFDATDEGVTFFGYFPLEPGQDAQLDLVD